MNGRNDRAFKRSFVAHPFGSFAGRSGQQKLVQFCSQPFAHLVSRAVGESDRDDLIYADVSRAEDLKVALDEHSRLAGARAGCYRNMPIQRMSGKLLLRPELATVVFTCSFHNLKDEGGIAN